MRKPEPSLSPTLSTNRNKYANSPLEQATGRSRSPAVNSKSPPLVINSNLARATSPYKFHSTPAEIESKETVSQSYHKADERLLLLKNVFQQSKVSADLAALESAETTSTSSYNKASSLANLNSSPAPVSKVAVTAGTTSPAANTKSKLFVLPKLNGMMVTLVDLDGKRESISFEVQKSADLQMLVNQGRKLKLLPLSLPLTFVFNQVPIPRQCWPAVEVKLMGESIQVYYRDMEEADGFL